MRAALVLFSMLMANYLNKRIDCVISSERGGEKEEVLFFFFSLPLFAHIVCVRVCLYYGGD